MSDIFANINESTYHSTLTTKDYRRLIDHLRKEGMKEKDIATKMQISPRTLRRKYKRGNKHTE